MTSHDHADDVTRVIAICDQINSTELGAKEARKAIQKKLITGDSAVQMLALSVGFVLFGTFGWIWIRLRAEWLARPVEKGGCFNRHSMLMKNYPDYCSSYSSYLLTAARDFMVRMYPACALSTCHFLTEFDCHDGVIRFDLTRNRLLQFTAQLCAKSFIETLHNLAINVSPPSRLVSTIFAPF
ncbi:hypothetical protein BC936DRAFT_138616 [Jimgerdemannia flammicorona]|uniref:VHS domain-containing protein n=1 Tax=Jimgerdemannia flammicorona TaxID=994334 RepID=A0A433BYE5_9FUNG|nr:hypothetical protein BC936DRAFT_138616 [Jimgerdemannia flammicorona]